MCTYSYFICQCGALMDDFLHFVVVKPGSTILLDDSLRSNSSLTLLTAGFRLLMYFTDTNNFTRLSFCTSYSLSVCSLTSLFVLKVSSHSEPSSQSLSLQQPAQPPPPPPLPPQPQYGLPVPESREKQLCFSDFEDLSASFRSLYKCVFEQSFSQQGGCRTSFCMWISVFLFMCACLTS